MLNHNVSSYMVFIINCSEFLFTVLAAEWFFTEMCIPANDITLIRQCSIAKASLICIIKQVKIVTNLFQQFWQNSFLPLFCTFKVSTLFLTMGFLELQIVSSLEVSDPAITELEICDVKLIGNFSEYLDYLVLASCNFPHT